MKKKMAMFLIENLGGLRTIRKDMWDWYGIKLTKQQAVAILNKCIHGGGYFECGFDTCCREYAAELIGQEITGMSWPLGQDTHEYTRDFFRKLLAGAKEKGYTIKASRYAEYFVPPLRMKLRFENDRN